MKHHLITIFNILAAQGSDDRDTHERSTSSSKQQAADRRIDIQPAEDEDGV